MKLKYYILLGVLLSTFIFSFKLVSLEISKERNKYIDDSSNCHISIDRPRIENKVLKKLIDEQLDAFRYEYLNNNLSGCKLNITYQNYKYKNYDSYLFIIKENNQENYLTIVFDNNENKLFSVNDLLEQYSISDLAILARKNLLYNPKFVNTTSIMITTEEKEVNYQSFVITENGILFLLTSYSLEVYEVLVSWDSLEL